MPDRFRPRRTLQWLLFEMFIVYIVKKKFRIASSSEKRQQKFEEKATGSTRSSVSLTGKSTLVVQLLFAFFCQNINLN